jgi:hypothetical protein
MGFASDDSITVGGAAGTAVFAIQVRRRYFKLSVATVNSYRALLR